MVSTTNIQSEQINNHYSFYLCFGSLHFHFLVPPMRGDVGPEWLVFNGKLMGNHLIFPLWGLLWGPQDLDMVISPLVMVI
jgi:hypothetical protein